MLHLTRWQVTRAIALPFAACVAYWLSAIAGLWVPAVLSLMVLSFVTYGSTSHDLVHGSLGLRRLANEILLSVIEAVALRSGHAYQVAHLITGSDFSRGNIVKSFLRETVKCERSAAPQH